MRHPCQGGKSGHEKEVQQQNDQPLILMSTDSVHGVIYRLLSLQGFKKDFFMLLFTVGLHKTTVSRTLMWSVWTYMDS